MGVKFLSHDRFLLVVYWTVVVLVGRRAGGSFYVVFRICVFRNLGHQRGVKGSLMLLGRLRDFSRWLSFERAPLLLWSLGLRV